MGNNTEPLSAIHSNSGKVASGILKAEWRNHYPPLFYLFLRLIPYLLFIVYWRFEPSIVIAITIFWMIDALPALYLHIQYWLRNKDEEYEIMNDGILLRKGGTETHYKNEDIMNIFLYLPHPAYRNSNFNLFLIGYYHYAVIRLKSKKILILTNLLSRTLENDLKQIEGVTVSRFKCTFCSL